MDFEGLRILIEKGDTQAALKQLRAAPELALQASEDGRPLLMAAARFDKDAPELVSAFLAAGADPNARSEDGMSPIFWAIDCNRPSTEGARVIEVLVRAGADVEQTGPYGWTPLMYAVERGGWQEVEALITAGARVDGRYPEDSPLEFARCEFVEPGQERRTQADAPARCRSAGGLIRNERNTDGPRLDLEAELFGCAPLSSIPSSILVNPRMDSGLLLEEAPISSPRSIIVSLV